MKHMPDDIEALRVRLAGSNAYRNYETTRAAVTRMLEGVGDASGGKSNYWKEEVAGFSYLWDASPLIVGELRKHCYHLTGVHDYDYRAHHVDNRDAFARKLSRLEALDTFGLKVTEPDLLGGFGHAIRGGRYNIDTLKYYEILLGLASAGLLVPPVETPMRVLEIGAGWGGLASQILSNAPSTRYVIVDLPEVILFSGTYLQSAFPKARILWLTPDLASDALQTDSYDIAFVPHYRWDDLRLGEIDLAINTVSFQEMTERQVDAYVTKLAASGTRAVYSLNRERSRYNREIESVSGILRRYFDIREITLLDCDYGELPGEPRTPTTLEYAKQIVKRALRRHAPIVRDPYRHLVGTARTAR